MKNTKLIIALLSISLLSGFTPSVSTAAMQESLPPVESSSPNTNYAPAFEGQTRISGVKTTTPYQVTMLSTGLIEPWAVSSLPDGRLVITEKHGALRIATLDGELSNSIGGFPAVDDRTQGGLLDVTPAPDFEESRMLYFTLSEMTAAGSVSAVGRGKLSADERLIEDFEIIYRALPFFNNSMHFGSRIVFDSRGNIFFSTGERSDLATRPMAQTLDNGYGKIIHITTEGEPVEENSFSGNPDALPEIYSYGHRNVQGLAFHPLTGNLWASEMGPRGGDELNLIEPAKNYGWPTISYGIEYSGSPVGEGITQKEGLEQPVYY